MEFAFKENIELMFKKFEDFVKEKTVIGEQIKIDNVTLIPAVTISFGMANGSGDNKDKKVSAGTGTGGGFAAKIMPTAMIVIKDNDVQVIPISKGHSFEKLIDMVPDIMEKINIKSKNESNSKEEE